jgi:putative ABC transport system ATP-binding protein
MALGDILVDVSGIAKHFGEGETRVDALRAVDLQVKAGEVIALLGPSGSGKTTLLNIIGCIIAPSAGRVVLDGEPVFDGKWLRRDLRRLRLDKIGCHFSRPKRTSPSFWIWRDGRPRPAAQGRANCWITLRWGTGPA